MKILSARAVAAKTSLSIPHIRRAAKEGSFPKSIQLSEARMGWLESDIDAWVSAISAASEEGVDNA